MWFIQCILTHCLEFLHLWDLMTCSCSVSISIENTVGDWQSGRMESHSMLLLCNSVTVLHGYKCSEFSTSILFVILFSQTWFCGILSNLMVENVVEYVTLHIQAIKSSCFHWRYHAVMKTTVLQSILFFSHSQSVTGIHHCIFLYNMSSCSNLTL